MDNLEKAMSVMQSLNHSPLLPKLNTLACLNHLLNILLISVSVAYRNTKSLSGNEKTDRAKTFEQ